MITRTDIFKILIGLFFILTEFSFAQDRPKILILHSYHPAYKWTHDINQGIHSVFNNTAKYDISVEYMDTKKYVHPSYFDMLKNMYEKKYKDITFDIIVSSDDNAFSFLKKYNQTVFKGVPIVFSGTNYLQKKSIQGYKNFTGVNEKVDLKKNYDLMLSLHPNTKHIYTITDTSKTGKIVRAEIESVTKNYGNKEVQFHIIDDVTVDELIKKIQNIPSNSVVLLTIFLRTKDQKYLEYYEAVELMDRYSTVPFYGTWDFSLGHGVVGGYMASGYFQGKSSALIAQKILSGVDISTIPILLESPNQYMFDYNQIEKYGVNESLLPKNSIIINKKTDFIEAYKTELSFLLIIFILMAIFIVLLLINIKKRKRAENRINKQLIFQQELIDNVHTPIYYKNINKEFIGCNKAFEKLIERPKSQIINKTSYDLVDSTTAKNYHDKDDELLQDKIPQEYEGSQSFENDVKKELIFYKNVFYEDGVVGGIVGAIFDITERKSLNHELNRLLSSFDANVIASKTDKEGVIVYVSKAFCDISGYREEEMIGQKHTILKDESNKSTLYEDLWNTIGSKKVWTGEIKNRKKSGEIYCLKTIITPEYDLNGNFLNYMAISQDVTAQKHIQQANYEIELLNEEILDTQKEILFRLGAIAEVRSKETGMHVKRVAEYSKLLALYYGLSENEAEIIKMASPMHDIGKIAIPDSILNKPGKLTSEEFTVMKTHAQIGYEMLKSSNKAILKAAAIIAHEHQEKYDGSGYPRSLEGENIHIYGRITAIADVFDALGSDRVYKKAWSDERIFEFFQEQSGKHFDPILISLFFKHLDQFLKIRNRLKDESFNGV